MSMITRILICLTVSIAGGKYGLAEEKTASPAALAEIPCEWTAWPLDGGGCIQGVVFDPRQPGLVYALCDVGGVFKSLDYGKSWRVSNRGLLGDNAFTQICALTVDPQNSAVLYLLTGTGYAPARGGLFKSTDRGESWQLLSREIWADGIGPHRAWGDLIVITNQEPAAIYVGTESAGVFKSQDAGATWANLGLDGKCVSGISFDPRQPDRLLVACRQDGIFLSEDAGRNWRKTAAEFSAWDLCRDPQDSSVVYAAAVEQGVYLSKNQGQDWTRCSTGIDPQSSVASVKISPTVPGLLFAATKNGKERYVYRSADGAQSWQKAPARIEQIRKQGWILENAPWLGLSAVKTLAFDPHNPSDLYAGDWYSVLRSRDRGESWDVLPNGLATLCVHSVRFNPTNPGQILIGVLDLGLYLSDDGGNTFRHPAPVSPHFAGTYEEIAGIAFDPFDPQTIVCAACRAWTKPRDGVIIKSRDGGKTWEINNGNLGNKPILDVAYQPQRRGEMYALVEKQGFFKSRDGGTTWQAGGTGLSPAVGLFNKGWGQSSIFVDPRDGQTLFIRQNCAEGLYRSENAGQTWERIAGIGSVATICADPFAPGTYFLGQYNGGLLQSTDGGKNWRRIFPAAGKSDSVVSLICDPHHQGRLFACLSASMLGNSDCTGILVSEDSGKTWRKFSMHGLSHDVFKCMDIDFDNQRIIVGTNGGSAFCGKFRP